MAKASNVGNGGIAGSGIFGFFGTTVHCSATDTSFFCSFMKIFNVLMVVGIIIFVLFTLYTFFIKPSLKKRR
jgi:hypothetical protein